MHWVYRTCVSLGVIMSLILTGDATSSRDETRVKTSQHQSVAPEKDYAGFTWGEAIEGLLSAKSTPDRIDGYPSLLARIKRQVPHPKLPDSANEEMLMDDLDDIISYWYGTEYDKNGTTKTPNQGKIACGYFVSTVLSHAGYRHDIAKVGQMPADEIIRAFCDPGTYSWYSKKPVEALEDHVRRFGPGYYILGLDRHVGLIRYDGEHVSFIHSNPLFPRKVIKEDVERSIILNISDAKVIGKLSALRYR